jgi:NAD(P)H-dependent nitrite reductase small subunit
VTDFVSIATTDDIPVGEGRVIAVRNREIALFNVGGAFYALENTCCHRGGPLGDGTLEGNTVTCPWHMWQFDIATGACANSPGDHVRTYDVIVEGDAVKVRL